MGSGRKGGKRILRISRRREPDSLPCAPLGYIGTDVYARIRAGELPAVRDPIPGKPSKGNWKIPAAAVVAKAKRLERAAGVNAAQAGQKDALHADLLRIRRARRTG